MYRQHVDALCFGRRHRGGNQLRTGAHIGIDKAEPVTLGQQCAAEARMRLADPTLGQHPRRGQPDCGMLGAAPLDRSRRAVLGIVVDNNDRPAGGKSGLRPQPVMMAILFSGAARGALILYLPCRTCGNSALIGSLP
jgi:hypothetical protein